MSLSGNLGFVSLDEVLRLLTRSGQRGSVAVRGEGVNGRVFVTRGGISVATTTNDEGLETLLLKARVSRPEDLGSGFDKDDHDVIGLLREITIESIYRLNLHGETFDVTEDEEARYASPKPFDLEQLLEDSRKRLEDWAEVSQVVSDLQSRISFVRELGDRDEVTIDKDAWRVLSEVGAGSSVAQIAAELGTTEFWTARIVARLVEDDLLQTEDRAGAGGREPYEEVVAAAPGHGYGVGYAEPADRSREATEARGDETEDDESAEAWGEPAYVPAGDERPEGEFDHDQSWWEEPGREAAHEEAADSEEQEGDVEEDTEAFLEKVFSGLEDTEEEEEEGYGLLRRRRLGALRDNIDS